MAVEIPFRREFSFEYGRLEPVAPMIRRIVARNPSPFTFRGTGTYVVGEGTVAVIDPGPDLREHVEALLPEVEERLRATLKAMDPEAMLKTWLPATLKGFEQLQEMFLSQLGGLGKKK